MTYQVHFVQDAKKDLLDIYSYIATSDSFPKAEKFLSKLKSTCLSLEVSPLRGRILSEFQSIGISQYREVFFKTYRIIYSVQGINISIYCILDGRRELKSLLEQRFLR